MLALSIASESACRRFGEGLLEHDARIAGPAAAFGIPVPAGRDGEWLAGDFHCHVAPPDGPREVRNGFADTLAMARAAGLDFVVLVPHVRGRFYEDARARARVAADQRALAERARGVRDIVVVPGVEYTDYDSGHVGVSFVDLAAVLESAAPFFDAVRERGGLMNLHHPYALPVRLPFWARGLPDMSWRPFTNIAISPPPEVAYVHAHYDAIEVFNHGKALIDRVIERDRFTHVRRAVAKADTEVVRRGRPIALVGGSDNHAFSLRATTYVFAKMRDARGIAKAVRGAHTCAMGPDACSLQARSNLDASWRIVGDEVRATAGDGGFVDVRWRGEGILIANGDRVHHGRGPVRLRVRADTYLRLETAASFSSHIAVRVRAVR